MGNPVLRASLRNSTAYRSQATFLRCFASDVQTPLSVVGASYVRAICDGLTWYRLWATCLRPHIPDGFNLGSSPRAVLFGKQHIVILVALERRIKVNQVHSLVFDVAPENVE